MAYLLIVDDDEDFASAAATMLRKAGHEVHVELDTDDAVKNMEERRPDLVILDVMFPEDASGGFELARTIRHYNEKLKGIPVLILTAVNAKFPLGFGRHDIDDNWLPVADFLEKPTDFGVLQSKVATLLAQATSQDDSSGQQT
jgi:DNA-binding response OmpR family regulator